MRAMFLLLMMAAVGLAAEVKVAPEVKAKVGRLLKVEATASDPKIVRWLNVHEDLDVIESETGRYATVLAVKPGRYKIALYSDAGGPPAYCVIVAEGEAPKPIDPPKPVDPPVPAPDAALVAALQSGYDADADANKADLKAKLAALYRAAPKTAADAAVTSWGQLFTVLSSVITAQVGPPDRAIAGTRKAVAAHLKMFLPAVPAKPLDDEGRKLAGEVFSRVAAALEAVK